MATETGVSERTPRRDTRGNGLTPEPPARRSRVLVTGGAGYIGCVLTDRLLRRGYEVRVLDRLWWGEEPLGENRERIELVAADIRQIPDGALVGIDAVIHLAGLSNDPTAEYDPEANWQMNALATAELGRACSELGIERLVFSSSCSLYDGLPAGMHDETAPIQPRGAYSESKRYAEEKLLELKGGPTNPAIVRFGTVYGYSPRMRFDLVVNTFVKDALLSGRLQLHGGGWMWRSLVDVRDAADALICLMEAPAEVCSGEIFNILHSNYQIRELAMLVAGSLKLLGREIELEEAPLPEFIRSYECSNAKAAQRLGFIPCRSVVEAVADTLEAIDLDDASQLSDPRHYNIRWIELMKERTPSLRRFDTVL